jgi:hypothetical protein
MSTPVIDLITDVCRLVNLIDDNESPPAEMGIKCLHILNEMMSDAQADGIRMGWYPIADADIATDAPIQEQDLRAVKACLALEVCPYFGVEPLQQLKDNAGDAYAKLAKRYVQYFESDTTFLPQGDAWANSWPVGPLP